MELGVGSETFAALEVGDAAGKPCVYLHGFPDHPPTAQPFLEALAARGYRVLAPWLRGYRPSPVDGRFDVESLAIDIAGVIAAWPGSGGGDVRVDVVGHDWGAAITYQLCTAHADRVARAVTLALPHPLTFLRQLRTAAQARRSWYMALFQLPGSGRLARAHDLALVDRLWRAWSPGFTLDDAQRADLHACLADSLPGPLEPYRAIARPLGDVGERLRRAARPIATPLLQLHGADDGCVLPPTLDDARRFTGPRQLEVVPGVGHFLHLEQPAAIAARAADWLAG
nr:alpha/beta hydrolase [Kofleriaceae bacterium]